MGIFVSFDRRNQEESGFDFGELEEAIVLPGVQINNNETKQSMLLCLSCSLSSDVY